MESVYRLSVWLLAHLAPKALKGSQPAGRIQEHHQAEGRRHSILMMLADPGRMAIAAAGLTDSRRLFYATAATVLPVLALVWVAGAAGLALQAAERADRFAQKWNQPLKDALDRMFPEPRNKTASMVVWFYLWFLGRQIPAWLRSQLAFVLLAVVGLPAAAEACAFTALLQDHDSPALRNVTAVGLVIAGVAVLIPVLQAVLILGSSRFPGSAGESSPKPPEENKNTESTAA